MAETQTLTNKTLTTPTIDGTLLTVSASSTFTGLIIGANAFLFGGATADEFETTLAITDPTADRIITFPNLTGTVSLITATETLTNKTLTSPTIDGVLTISATTSNTGLIIGTNALLFGGSTGNNFELTLVITDPTADRNATIPDLNANDTFVFLAETQTLTNKTLTTPTIDGGVLTVSASSTFTPAADGWLQILTGNLKVGNGIPSVDLDGEDAYIEGTFEVDGTVRFDGAVTANATTTIAATLVQRKGADLASATTMAIPDDGNIFTVTGNTTTTSITAGQSGRIITLIFSGTAESGGGMKDGSNLKIKGNFEYVADDTMTLVSDGTNWFEISRSN